MFLVSFQLLAFLLFAGISMVLASLCISDAIPGVTCIRQLLTFMSCCLLEFCCCWHCVSAVARIPDVCWNLVVAGVSLVASVPAVCWNLAVASVPAATIAFLLFAGI